MLLKSLLSVVVVTASVAPACAQPSPQPDSNGQGSAMRLPTQVATQWTPIPGVSLAQLINTQGYQVVSESLSMMGLVVLLQKDKRYVFCGIKTPGGLTGGSVATSECDAIN